MSTEDELLYCGDCGRVGTTKICKCGAELIEVNEDDPREDR